MLNYVIRKQSNYIKITEFFFTIPVNSRVPASDMSGILPQDCVLYWASSLINSQLNLN
jgi:hypothetical protein